MIGKVMRGTDVIRLIWYLYGPGRREEHTDPHIVAGWRDPGELEPARRTDGSRDFRQAHRTAAPASRRTWPARAGAARAGNDAVRWIAVRHGQDHIHIVAMLARQYGTRPRLWNDYYRLGEACRAAEERYDLTRTPVGREGPSPLECRDQATLVDAASIEEREPERARLRLFLTHLRHAEEPTAPVSSRPGRRRTVGVSRLTPSSSAWWTVGQLMLVNVVMARARCLAMPVSQREDVSMAGSRAECVPADDLDLNLSAQSGYDKDTSITWTFPKGGGFLCGTNNLPSKAPWNVMDVSKSGSL